MGAPGRFGSPSDSRQGHQRGKHRGGPLHHQRSGGASLPGSRRDEAGGSDAAWPGSHDCGFDRADDVGRIAEAGDLNPPPTPNSQEWFFWVGNRPTSPPTPSPANNNNPPPPTRLSTTHRS